MGYQALLDQGPVKLEIGGEAYPQGSLLGSNFLGIVAASVLVFEQGGAQLQAAVADRRLRGWSFFRTTSRQGPLLDDQLPLGAGVDADVVVSVKGASLNQLLDSLSGGCLEG